MKIRRGNREYVLMEDELYRAHKEFVASFMIDRLEVDFGVPKAYAIEYGEKAYDRYCDGDGETEYECIEWAAEEYEKKYGEVA
ncbi:Uncharacterised protein [uncultured Clostridium sp.]|nr:Uncharacterised protein [uncultured Clostridium sp.]